MDWARDKLGALVEASRGGRFSFGLTCPCCGEPVRRKSGPQRRAHFAHFSNRAKPECELFCPSLSSNGVSSRSSVARERFSQRPLSLGGTILLQRRARGGPALYIRLPRFPALSNNGDLVEVRTGIGVRSYSIAQLERTRTVPATPDIPLAEVSTSDALEYVAEAINQVIQAFRPIGNYFLATEVAGRLLGTEEPLEWGGRYLLLTQQPLLGNPQAHGVAFGVCERLAEWHYYELSIQTEPLAGADTTGAIDSYLGRAVVFPKARAYFVDPPPHHIELDGTYVFPDTTTCITLRYSGKGDLIYEQSGRVITGVNVTHVTADLWEVTYPTLGEFSILLDGREQLVGKIEYCELFRPRGVTVRVGDRGRELFEPELRDSIDRRQGEYLRIECPNSLVASQVVIAPEGWSLEGNEYILGSGFLVTEIVAGNFGSVARRIAVSVQPPTDAVEPAILARRLWIEGLVTQGVGPQVCARLRDSWSQTTLTDHTELASDAISWLRPYIRSASAKTRD